MTDPEDPTLVFTRVETGKAGADRYKVFYSRGTNSNESLNRGMEGVLPPSGNLQYISTLLRWYVGGVNQDRGEERLGQAHIGCYDLPLTHKVQCLA